MTNRTNTKLKKTAVIPLSLNKKANIICFAENISKRAAFDRALQIFEEKCLVVSNDDVKAAHASAVAEGTMSVYFDEPLPTSNILAKVARTAPEIINYPRNCAIAAAMLKAIDFVEQSFSSAEETTV